VVNWYQATSKVDPCEPPPRLPAGVPDALDQALLLAIRPFLSRCAESLLQRPEFADWHHGTCPICGWEPDFAVVLATGERRLVCGRCVAQWGCGSHTCPYCGNDERSRVTSFATRDGRYRVYACDNCRRYLKALDGRHAARPLLITVDTIATLPLDAAAMSKGYQG
jgi:FdhE protein